MARLPITDDNITYLNLGDKYTISQFQELARTISTTSTHKSRKFSKNPYDKVKVSPRQEIYKSMLREIRSTESPPMSSLVHKASGILRLDHYKKSNKNPKVMVSWDIDGRRVLTYEGKGGTSTTALGRETNFEKPRKKKLLESLNKPMYGLDFQNFAKLSKDYDETGKEYLIGSADYEIRLGSPISKVWENYIDTGDASKLWDSKQEAIIPKSKRSVIRQRCSSRGSNSSYSESKISDESPSGTPPPYWKSAVKPSRERIKSWESTKTLWGSPHLLSTTTIGQSSEVESRKSRSHISTFSSRPSRTGNDEEEKVDRVQHICVVNGSVVSFKDFSFDNFTNWFGDESVLEANQQRCQPKFHLELDLTNVENKDIKIRLLEGYKLEIVARRKIEGSKKPLRMKEYLFIPKGYRPEDILLCRTKAGKLVVEELTPEPLELATPSKTRLSKSKSSVLNQQQHSKSNIKRVRI